jgi:hypothetical protein
MLRALLFVLLAAAACRGERSDANCTEARNLYIAHQAEAVDRAVAAMPSPKQRNLLLNQARDEINRAERQFVAVCQQMDSGQLLACLRSAESMNDPACEPVADELKRRMTP